MLDSVSFKYFLGALISLVVITNPLSKIPLFMSLAAGMTHEQRKQQANLAAIYSFAVMFVSLIGGNLILSFFGISFGAMRVAGGFVIAIIGTQMLFGGQGPNNAPAVQRGKEDYSFFPLAMPGIAGPGIHRRRHRLLHKNCGSSRICLHGRNVPAHHAGHPGHEHHRMDHAALKRILCNPHGSLGHGCL